MLHFLSNEELKNLLAFSSTVSTIFQFASGILVVRNYFKKKSCGETSSLPFTSGLLSCSLWLRYGVLILEPTLVLVNAIGVFLFAIYCLSYGLFTVNKKRFSHQILLVLLMITFSIVYSRIELDDVKASKLIGILCCSVGIIFFASPLIKLRHVILTKNSDCLPFPLIFCSFIVCLQWWFYGYLISDNFVQIPNALGCLLSLIQLSLFVIYPSKNDIKYKLISTQDIIL